jgi:hypothetical protein
MANFLAAVLALAAVLQRPPDSVGLDTVGLEWLHGSWQGAGTMFGRASTARLEVRPTLGSAFLELSWRASDFEGRAFYRPAGVSGRWRATWFDNRGTSFPIEAVAAGRTLTAEWGSAGTERGRTIYRLLPDGRLEVTDHAGGREFARHILTRG